jgi:hypothetical protein
MNKKLIIISLLLAVFTFNTCKELKKEMLVSTDPINTITANTAEATGSVVDLGDGVSQHGHCWSTTSGVTTSSTTKTALGVPPGMGGFTSQLTNLTAGTKYYVKAYLTNGAETVYSKEVSFTTLAASAPTLTTTTITSISSSGAVTGGNISNDGGSPITARGVCWGTTTLPVATGNNKTSDGTGTGPYTSNLSALPPGKTYYVRAYAIDIVGTSYGNELVFSTNPIAPLVTTSATINITSTTASGGGNVTDDGGATVTERGVCWNLMNNPTINNFKTSNGTGSGSFTSNLTSLTQATTYYVRAYATNSVGTSYGLEHSFTTIGSGLVVPTISTTAASAITQTTASSGGNVTSDGGSTITQRGVCYNTAAGPTTANSILVASGTTGSFTRHLQQVPHQHRYQQFLQLQHQP